MFRKKKRDLAKEIEEKAKQIEKYGKAIAEHAINLYKKSWESDKDYFKLVNLYDRFKEEGNKELATTIAKAFLRPVSKFRLSRNMPFEERFVEEREL